MGYSTYGDGKAIIEILNIGFEPLLTNKEYKIYKNIGLMKKKGYHYQKAINIINSKLLYIDECETRYSWLLQNLELCVGKFEKCKKIELYANNIFKSMLMRNTKTKRNLYDCRKFNHDDQFRNIAIFESDLTRSFGCSDMDHSDDIISVVTYYTEIFESIMMNGFDYKGKHFVFFTAGAGQTRCKKSTFVSEDKLDQNFNRLFCGLTRDKINKQGGMNTNKYLAYTSLCQTNSEIWKDFNIDRAIVVDDIEYIIPNQKVRYIYTESPEDKELIESLTKEIKQITDELKYINENKSQTPKGNKRSKQEISHEKRLKQNRKDIQCEINKIRQKYHKAEITLKDISIPFTDGFGISLKKMQSSMIRLPFIKGLITYVPKRAFKEWCKDNNKKIYKIIDIYDVEHSIDDIDYIFTKSQFKMYKYYNNISDSDNKLIKSGWDVYKENFKKYSCDACRCNVERNVKLNAKTNYQILQTITTEMNNKEIEQLSSYDISNLNGIGNDVQSMLNILGANKDKNDRLNYFQQSLILYPEMFKDYYVKSSLKNTKDSMLKKFRSGKFNIEGAYTYAIPDVLACLQWWFNQERDLNNLGFVKDDEVYCDLFDDGEDIDCVRSPHLDHAHCIRKNTKRNSDKKWVKSKGIYIGVKDMMSKLLMYDNDGDKLLAHKNKTIIDCALRFQKKYGMIPNYYDMPKANAQLLNNRSLFEGIVLAYHHGNIGTPSNEITKIFMTLNTDSKEQEVKNAIEVVALRVVDVNFTIDYAKTLYKPTIPKHISEKYKIYSGKKVPHFFIYAKNKKVRQVEKIGKCNIDRISNVVKSNRIVFKNLLGKYTYKKLMNNPDTDINSDKAKEIINLYYTINDANIRKLSYIDFDSLEIDEKNRLQLQLEFDSTKQRKMFEDYVCKSAEYITDVLVKALQDDIRKDTMWRLFGDIIYKNLEYNLKGTKICGVCDNRFYYNTKSKKTSTNCPECSKKIHRDQKTKSERFRRKLHK